MRRQESHMTRVSRSVNWSSVESELATKAFASGSRPMSRRPVVSVPSHPRQAKVGSLISTPGGPRLRPGDVLPPGGVGIAFDLLDGERVHVAGRSLVEALVPFHDGVERRLDVPRGPPSQMMVRL